MVNPRVVIITQARMGSSRFPDKILKPLAGKAMLTHHLQRLKQSRLKSEVMVATTFEEGVEQIIALAEQNQVRYYQGSMENVLDRIYQAAKTSSPDYVVRVTSDCPLIDPQLIDEVIKMTLDQELDYGANILEEEFPDGQDIEVMRFAALEKAWKEAKLQSDREHVTPYIRKNGSYAGGTLFMTNNLHAPIKMNHIRMTVDEPIDLSAMELLVNRLGETYDWKTYAEYIQNHTSEFSNQTIIRNEGYLKSLKNEEE